MIYPFSQRVGQARQEFWRNSLNRGTFGRDFTLGEWPEERLPKPTPADTLDQTTIYAGLDLGQLSDPAALAIVRLHRYDERFVGPRWPYLELCRLRIWPPGTARYEDIAQQALWYRPDVLCFDYNGVGGNFPFTVRTIAKEMRGPNGEHLEPWQGKLVPVQTVGSLQQAMTLAMSPESKFTKIAKKDLVSGLNILAHTRVLYGCTNCSAVKVGELATIRLGDHAGKECKVLDRRSDGWVVAIDGVGKRLCGERDLFRTRPTQSCERCAYLRFCLPDPKQGKLLLQEMASFLERHSRGGGTIYEHRTKTGHGDRVIALALAVMILVQGRRELVWR